MGELLHHTLKECGDEGSVVFRGTQREPVRNLGHVHIWTVSIKYYISQLNILSTVYVTQTKIHQSNNAFQHTHNPVDEEGTQKLIKVHNAQTQGQLNTMLVVIQKTAHSYLFTIKTEREVM